MPMKNIQEESQMCALSQLPYPQGCLVVNNCSVHASMLNIVINKCTVMFYSGLTFVEKYVEIFNKAFFLPFNDPIHQTSQR